MSQELTTGSTWQLDVPRHAKVVLVDLQSLRFRFQVRAGQPGGVSLAVGCWTNVASDGQVAMANYGVDGPLVDVPLNMVVPPS